MAKEIKHVDLTAIKDPEFLKSMSYKELDVLSDDIRKYIIDITSKNGGHLSANLGTVEATIALCRSFDFLSDKIIFDVGHQCYTYKLLTGRQLDTLRKKDGISGFQKMSESPYDHFEAGHSQLPLAPLQVWQSLEMREKKNTTSLPLLVIPLFKTVLPLKDLTI